MLIGLCAECDAVIMLRNSTNYKILDTVNAKGSSEANHGLPMWQSVRIKINSSTDHNNVIIQVIPKFNGPNSTPLWAIANVHQCPTNGSSSCKLCQNLFNAKYFIHMLVKQF